MGYFRSTLSWKSRSNKYRFYGNLANYDLISLEKLANHFIKIEKYNEHGMVK